MKAGASNRNNVVCPSCGIVERHRLLWLYLKNKTTLFNEPNHLLYLAPVDILQKKIQQYNNVKYLSADLSSALAMQHFDIMDIPIPNDTFSFIICSHILAHVKDDKKALAELYRILQPNGKLIILDGYEKRLKTIESKEVKTPEQRKKLYGQSDRWRLHGQDFLEVIASFGFEITKDDFANTFTESELFKLGIDREEVIYLCEKKI